MGPLNWSYSLGLASLELAALMGHLLPWTCVFCTTVTEEMKWPRVTQLRGSNHWDCDATEYLSALTSGQRSMAISISPN